jgi:hypothetical protein
MWSIYGSNRYLPLLDMSIKSAVINSPNIDRVILADQNIDINYDNCTIVRTEFKGDKASKMSLRYDFASILLDKYDYVLHVDADALVFRDVSNIWVKKEPGLSLASEYTNAPDSFKPATGVQSYSDEICWAGPLLSPQEVDDFKKIPSLCMGVWLASRDDKQALLRAREEVVYRESIGFRGMCVDQHAAVYRLIKDNTWNTHLQQYVTHIGNTIKNREDVQKLYSSSHAICHFAGGAEASQTKFDAMKILMNEIEKKND